MPERSFRVQPVDLIGLVMALFGAVWAAVVITRVQPAFLRMFADFSTGALPRATWVCLHPLMPALTVLLAFVPPAQGIFSNASPSGRAWRAGITIVWTLLGAGLLVLGLYLPIFTLAAAVE